MSYMDYNNILSEGLIDSILKKYLSKDILDDMKKSAVQKNKKELEKVRKEIDKNIKKSNKSVEKFEKEFKKQYGKNINLKKVDISDFF